MAAPRPTSITPLQSIESPQDGFSYTPSDSTPIMSPESLAVTARAVTVQVAGDLKVTFLNGKVRTIPSYAVPAGARLSMQITKIHATGTTATGIFVWL